MTLIKWIDPSMGREKKHQLMPSAEHFFGSFFHNDLFTKEYAGFVPTVNISEKENTYVIELSAPGFEKKDFTISVDEGVLTISGKNETENATEGKHYVRKEFNYGSFSRSFNLTDLVDEDKIDAKYENGILKIELPKNEKTKIKNVKQIQID
ncbi:MAG: Hsp20/alpha crystallin family protein [Bacteroidota bacterium]